MACRAFVQDSRGARKQKTPRSNPGARFHLLRLASRRHAGTQVGLAIGGIRHSSFTHFLLIPILSHMGESKTLIGEDGSPWFPRRGESWGEGPLPPFGFGFTPFSTVLYE